MKNLASAIVLAVAGLAPPGAMAASFYLNDDVDPGACTQGGTNANNYNNTYTCSEQFTSADELDVKAYAAGTGANFAAANVADWSTGFGVRSVAEGLNASDPQHSMDNDGTQDLLLFKFDTSFALTSFQLGWYATDSDVSILAYTGSGDATSALTGSNEGNLLSSGWTLVGNFADNLTNNVSFNAGPGSISSSYWIVSAFSKFGQSDPNWTDANDYVKLKAVGGNFTCVNSNDPGCTPPPQGAPEPASLALVGAALYFAVGARRRAKTIV